MIYGADLIYFIYLWFTEMKWFFRDNENDSGTGNPTWKGITISSEPFRYMIAIGLIVLFTFGLIFGSAFAGIYLLLIFIGCVIGVITFKSSLNKVDDKDTFKDTSLTIINETYKHYKVQMMFMFSFILVLVAFIKLGAIGLITLIIPLLIYFGKIAIDNFIEVNEDGFKPILSYKQAKKTCTPEAPVKLKISDNNSILSLIYNFFMGSENKQTGGNLKTVLKKLSKNYNANKT
jgi:hypothetical protein